MSHEIRTPMNAIKFTESGSVWLNISCEREENNAVQVSFTVKDTEIGMTCESLTTLFKPFTQADNSIARKFGGTGLGLSICQRLVIISLLPLTQTRWKNTANLALPQAWMITSQNLFVKKS